MDKSTTATNRDLPHPGGSPTTTTKAGIICPFNDRDFTSVAELMLVPGCPPGSSPSNSPKFAALAANSSQRIPDDGVPPTIPPSTALPQAPPALCTGTPAVDAVPEWRALRPRGTPLVAPHVPLSGRQVLLHGSSLPLCFRGRYLGHRHHQASVGTASAMAGSRCSSSSRCPARRSARSAGGQGTNFDWQRQDLKAGQLNLNLIVDEEVFFSVLGKQNSSFTQSLMNFLADSCVAGARSRCR